MQAIIINNKSYYLCTDLFEYHKDDFNEKVKQIRY